MKYNHLKNMKQCLLRRSKCVRLPFVLTSDNHNKASPATTAPANSALCLEEAGASFNRNLDTFLSSAQSKPAICPVVPNWTLQ
jgi:hypothetical protein